jgi:hypothetical protein
MRSHAHDRPLTRNGSALHVYSESQRVLDFQAASSLEVALAACTVSAPVVDKLACL